MSSSHRNSDNNNVDQKHVNPRMLELRRTQSSWSFRLSPIKEHTNETSETQLRTLAPLKDMTRCVPNPNLETRKPQPFPPAIPTTDAFKSFAHHLPFTLILQEIAYPTWSTTRQTRLPYLPIPLKELAHIPPIPSKLEISFTQVMDTACFIDTLNGVLASHGYTSVSSAQASKVYISYTARNSKRLRVAVAVERVELITAPWARDVWLGHLDAVVLDCGCELCCCGLGGGRMDVDGDGDGEKRYGHGLEIDVVFPQGTSGRYQFGSRDMKTGWNETFGGKVKKPVLPVRAKKSRKRDQEQSYRSEVGSRKVRFNV